MIIAKEIERLGPWITQVTVDSEVFGGSYDAYNDKRVTLFVNRFKDLFRDLKDTKILECGCLEGGHTVRLSRSFPHITINAVDARSQNLEKAQFHTKIHNLNNVVFKTVDLENEQDIFKQSYSAIFCVGLLYHLRNPSDFLARCAKSSPNIWISTVISSEYDAEILEKKIYRGKYYTEPTEHPLSGLGDTSFFPSLGSLCNMLWEAGYTNIEIIEQTMTPNGNGPAVLLLASIMSN